MKEFKLTKEEQSILIAALLEYENKMRLLKIRSEEKKAMMLRYKLLKKQETRTDYQNATNKP